MLSTSILYKILPTNLGCANQPFILFMHHSWGETVLFIIQTSDRMQYSQFFKTNCTQTIFGTINRGLLAKPFKKFPKSTVRPAGSHSWQAPNLQWTLTELRFNIIEILLCLFFYLRVLQRCVILKSVWYARHFELTPASDVHERLKTNGTAIKIARETTNNQ